MLNDAKALAIIATDVQLQKQTNIRSATTARHSWIILHELYNCSTLHNRVKIRRRLH